MSAPEPLTVQLLPDTDCEPAKAGAPMSAHVQPAGQVVGGDVGDAVGVPGDAGFGRGDVGPGAVAVSAGAGLVEAGRPGGVGAGMEVDDT